MTVTLAVDGRFIVFNPTFNITLSCTDGKSLLSFAGARDCKKRGFELTYAQLSEVEERRKIDNYYLPYDSFIYYTGTTAVNFFPN